jgi:CRP-like cAMP-binding protein
MNADDFRHNAILAKLPSRELKQVQKHSQLVRAEVRAHVFEPGRPIRAVYFPLTAVYSIVAVTDGRAVGVEVATTGREGMVGLPVFLGAASSPHSGFCQIAGSSVKLNANALRQALADGPVLHRTLNRFTQATMVQVAQNVVCNNTHSTAQRAARWLLSTHDRVARDEFPLTQEFLAQMLGVRRPTVSEVASRLQSEGLIGYSRGVLRIVDRHGLEKASCACYGIVKAEFDAIADGR